jgi:hypothetical protein
MWLRCSGWRKPADYAVGYRPRFQVRRTSQVRRTFLYPLITASGRKRATLRAIPAPWTTWTTLSTSL